MLALLFAIIVGALSGVVRAESPQPVATLATQLLERSPKLAQAMTLLHAKHLELIQREGRPISPEEIQRFQDLLGEALDQQIAVSGDDARSSARRTLRASWSFIKEKLDLISPIRNLIQDSSVNGMRVGLSVFFAECMEKLIWVIIWKYPTYATPFLLFTETHLLDLLFVKASAALERAFITQPRIWLKSGGLIQGILSYSAQQNLRRLKLPVDPKFVVGIAVDGESGKTLAILKENAFLKNAPAALRMILDADRDSIRRQTSHLTIDELESIASELEVETAGLSQFKDNATLYAGSLTLKIREHPRGLELLSPLFGRAQAPSLAPSVLTAQGPLTKSALEATSVDDLRKTGQLPSDLAQLLVWHFQEERNALLGKLKENFFIPPKSAREALRFLNQSLDRPNGLFALTLRLHGISNVDVFNETQKAKVAIDLLKKTIAEPKESRCKAALRKMARTLI